MKSKALAPALLAALTLAFAAAAIAFVWQPVLASFADDSVSYLIMAQVFSPWQAATPAVAEAFAREAFYPPLFPALLAVLNASHDFARAHAVPAVLMAACLPLLYLLGGRWLGNRWGAFAVAATTALLPSLWLSIKGILSEPLFCMLLLATLLAADREEATAARRWQIALLMSLLVMTRTVGLVVVAAYGLWALARGGADRRARLLAAAPAALPVIAYGAWVMLRPAETADDYLRIVSERSELMLAGAAVVASVLRQAAAMWEAWLGSLLLFWVEGKPVRVALAGAVGSMALAGLALRLRAGKADAWLVLAYLLTFLAWPFYDQMVRFLLPVLPLLVLYAFSAARAASDRLGRSAGPAYGLLALLVASLALPGLAFIQQRSSAGGPQAMITDWYRTPQLSEARLRAGTHLGLLDDMQVIRERTPADARVMWYVPAYVALLADRRALPTPPPELPAESYREWVRLAAPDYLFLSAYHPRDTIRESAWRAGRAAMGSAGAIVHQRARAESPEPGAMLIELSPLRARGPGPLAR